MGAPARDISQLILDTLDSSAAVGFAYVDLDLRFVRVNQALADMQGIAAEDHAGRHIREIAPDLWSQLAPLLHQVIETGEPVINREITGARPGAEGTWGAWQNSLHPVMVDGEPVGIACLVVDSTERQRAEQFRSVAMQTMVEGLFALDHDGTVQYMNVAAVEMLGWTEDELRGRPFAETEAPLRAALEHGRTMRSIDGELPRNDGTMLPVSYSAAPLVTGDESVRGVVVVFRDVTEERAEQQRQLRELADLTWLARVRSALDEERFVLYSQPIVPLGAGERSEELLIRMVTPEGEVIGPCAFLPAAEEYGLITEIDRWVIRQAARLAGMGRRVEINLSAKSTTDPKLFSWIEQELRAESADPANLVFELTETALMGDWEAGTTFSRRLVELGCGLALDDFGTGFGSLTYLKALPIRCLKIDIDFVRDLACNETNQHLVKAIVHLAGGFGLETIAEGVEDEETLALLREYGVDYAQGYYLGRPAPIEDGSMSGCTSPTARASTSSETGSSPTSSPTAAGAGATPG